MANSKLFPTSTISGRLSASGSLSGKVNDSVTSKYTKYDGNYEITPRAYESTELETKNKVMTDNLTVLEVPYWETSNPSNGLTVYIAQEV